MTLDDLSKLALVGTGRGPLPALSADDPQLAAALAAIASAPTEEKLLAAAALVAGFEACGTSPATASTPAAVSPAETRPACSPRAADVLDRVLRQPNNDTKRLLTIEWCTTAAAASLRVPHRLLYTLLEYSGSLKAVRESVAGVIGRRGNWLTEQNPRWQFAGKAEAAAAEIWDTGNREQRGAALRRLREIDPAAARDLVRSTWKQDAADERTHFIEAFAINLSASDEAFLESALDDRSKLTSAAAAAVLAKLPTSKLVERAGSRVEPLLHFTPPIAGGLLRKAKPAVIEVEMLAAQFDPAWARDGIVEKPVGNVGLRQWWTTQMVALVPTSVWSAKFNLTPAECVAAVSGDFRGLLLDAWSAAAQRYRDDDWIQALLKESLDKPKRARWHLLRELSPATLRRELPGLLALPYLDPMMLNQILTANDEPLDRESLALITRLIDRMVDQSGRSYLYELSYILESLVHRIASADIATIDETWGKRDWAQNRKAFETFFTTLHLRRAIHTELRP